MSECVSDRENEKYIGEEVVLELLKDNYRKRKTGVMERERERERDLVKKINDFKQIYVHFYVLYLGL